MIYDFDLSDFFEMILILIEIFFSNDFDNTADELYYTYTMIYEHGLRVRTKQSVHARHTNFCKLNTKYFGRIPLRECILT